MYVYVPNIAQHITILISESHTFRIVSVSLWFANSLVGSICVGPTH